MNSRFQTPVHPLTRRAKMGMNAREFVGRGSQLHCTKPNRFNEEKANLSLRLEKQKVGNGTTGTALPSTRLILRRAHIAFLSFGGLGTMFSLINCCRRCR